MRLCARLGLALAAARFPLNLAAHRNSLAHSTKGTPSRPRAAPTACRHTVSGTVSLPSRGAFHLSLTVLLHYRSLGSILAWRVVPPASHRIPRARRYSGYVLYCPVFVYGTVTPYGLPSHAVPLTVSSIMTSATPMVLLPSVWPLSLSLAATKKISFDYSSSAYLDVSVQRVPFVQLCIYCTMSAD